MFKKLGELKLGGVFGGYEIINQSADKMPQDLASATGIINEGLLGATYMPIWIVGKQVVKGLNYLIIAKEIRSTKDQDTKIVAMIINLPPGSIGGKGATVVEIIEEAKLTDEIKVAFETAVKTLTGVAYKPIAFMGEQVVKGINYYYVAEAKVLYPGSQPYGVILCVNVFNGVTSIVSIEHIS